MPTGKTTTTMVLQHQLLRLPLLHWIGNLLFPRSSPTVHHTTHSIQATHVFCLAPTSLCPLLPSPMPTCHKQSIYLPHTIYCSSFISIISSATSDSTFLHCIIRTHRADLSTIPQNVWWVFTFYCLHANHWDDSQKWSCIQCNGARTMKRFHISAMCLV